MAAATLILSACGASAGQGPTATANRVVYVPGIRKAGGLAAIRTVAGIR
jgi:hypothetical protein